MALKFCFSVIILVACVKLTLAYSNHVCSYILQGGEDVCKQSGTSSSQGKPGKRGAAGSPGPKGEQGEDGAPGKCDCDEAQFFNALKDIPNIRKLFCTVGIELGTVPNEDITASSSWSDAYLPGFARIDSKKSPKADYWHPASGTYQNQWIQVDLKKPTRITRITTQGCPSENYWVTTFTVRYGNTIGGLRPIRDQRGTDLIFRGNRDRYSLVTNNFPSPVTARYFRILLNTYNSVPVLRFELLKC